jgi:hypothetical protein
MWWKNDMYNQLVRNIFRIYFWIKIAPEFIPGFLVGSVLLIFLVFLMVSYYVSLRSVLWCPLLFPHKTMFGSSLPPGSCLIYVLFVDSGVQHIFCYVFVLFFFVLCTLCCQFLWIVHFWLPLRYSLTFIYLLKTIRYDWCLNKTCFCNL